MLTKMILNPHADVGNGIKYLQSIQEAARPFGRLDIELTEGSGHARTISDQAIADGYDLVVAAGGDGTINEVVNSLMKVDGDKPLLGIVPIGTGNDFAFAAGVDADVTAAVQNLFKGRTRIVDIALLEDDQGHRRYFDNNLGIGFDANVVIRTAAITQVHGFLKYFLGVLTTLARDFYPIGLQMRFDEEEFAQESLFISFGIGTRHGGGFLLTPEASNTDGLVDTCTVAMLGRFKALTLLSSAMKGTHVTTPYVTMRQNKSVTISSAEAMPIHIDGEIYAYPSDNIHFVTITSIPGALRVVY